MSAAVKPAGAETPSPDAKADLRALIEALVKIALVGPQGEVAGWKAEALAAQRRLRSVAAPALADHWGPAVARAERDPAVRRDETINPTLPTMAPLGLEALVLTSFDLDAAVQAIRDSASFG